MVCSPTSAAVSACAEASDTINCTASRSATRKPRDRRSRVIADEFGDRPLGQADDGRAQREQRHQVARRAVKRIVGMNRRARRGPGLQLAHADRAVRRHGGILDDERFAARSAQAHDVPVVDDLDLTPRNEEHPRFRRAGAFGHGAEQEPLRMIAAAGEGPSAAQPMTAGHDLRRAVRRDTRRRDRVGIVVPHLVLRAFRKIADHPAVLAMHGGDPGRRTAALGQRAEHFGEHAVVGAEAAEHRWAAGSGSARGGGNRRWFPAAAGARRWPAWSAGAKPG